MSSHTAAIVTRVLTAWTLAVQRNAGAVVIAFAVLTGGAGWYAATHLQVDADPSSLLSPDLPWRKAEAAYSKAFPDSDKTIVAVIEAAPEQADDALQRLSATLAAQPEFAKVFSLGSGEFFERNALLYLDAEQLDGLSTALETAQPFLGRLTADPSLAGLFGLLQQAMTQPGASLPFELSTITDPISKTVNAADAGQNLPLSWQSLVMPVDLSGGKRFLMIKPSDKIEDRAAVLKVRSTIASLQLDAAHGVRVRLTGSIPMWLDEMDAAFDGAILSGLASLILVAGFLYAGLRSLNLVLSCLVALISGLILTAGFAVIGVGRLNLISIAFATLYIGIAIDYGVQFGMRYRELVAGGLSSHNALTETGGKFGEALVLCALATLVGFYAFIPTSYRGVAELGVIAGTGILIGLFTSLTLLPALIEKWPPKADSTKPTPLPQALTWLGNLPIRHPRGTRRTALVLALIGLATLPWVRFDYNPMHLKPPHTESLEVFEDLAKGPESPLSASLLAPSAEQAAQLSKKLNALPEVGRVLSLESFVPAQQDDKLMTLDSLNLSLGVSVPENLELKPVDPVRDIAAITALRDAARGYGGDASTKAAATHLADTLDTWLKKTAAAPIVEQTTRLSLLSDALLGAMPKLMRRLHNSLSATPVTLADLPADLRRQWVSADGQYRLDISPKENVNEDEALIRFADAVQTVAPQSTGAPVAYVAGARTVMGAFAQAFTGAFILITILLLVLLRSFKDTIRTLVPLVLGSLLLAAVSVVINLQLNFANVIALPLLLGIGVDIGIVILWRARNATADESNPVMTSTGAAVAISALTTLTSFASLMLSVHRGMFSMGLLLTVGLLLYLACTFLVLPSLLVKTPHKSVPEKQN
ncbi:MMPL family transporter [Stenotrophobium rhamnosiphilum]|nr:MMPL family transporter [Stenotrophobium rhamnosiphilum]